MRRFVLLTLVALIALTEACAVGPRYRRSSLGLPDGWRRPAVSEDSLRSFYDSLRTSREDRKSTRLNSSHLVISYAVFCLKKKKKKKKEDNTFMYKKSSVIK